MFSLWYNRFMDKKYEKISQDLGVTLKQIDTVLSLTAEGATIPFIARYRKDMTGKNVEPRQPLPVKPDSSHLLA